MRSSLHTCCCRYSCVAFFFTSLSLSCSIAHSVLLSASLFIYLLSTWSPCRLFFHQFAYFLLCCFKIISLYYSLFGYYFQMEKTNFIFYAFGVMHRNMTKNIVTQALNEEMPRKRALFTAKSVTASFQS